MILQNVGWKRKTERREKRKRGEGEERRREKETEELFFRNYYYLTITLLLPLEVKVMNNMCVKEKKIIVLLEAVASIFTAPFFFTLK